MAKDCTQQRIETPGESVPGQVGVRASRAGRWRAIVLIAVHVLIAIHVGHWLATGSTVSPLEPSEAMQFSQKSVVNAGFVLFALAIASTLIVGRWFCGWACHLVALQDLCRWLLLKVGIRPKEVRLGVLGVVPWLAFVYMFVAPLVYRLRVGESVAVESVELTTPHFWETFPGLAVAILTFLGVGFAIVYLLGSKAFCSYGCPYGGIFGLVDQLAPMRIRVTDACEGCGHCTTSCSSNVVVHQEVHDYGAVVDPGCMKCMDCVSVCPKDALYVGFGAPAVLTSRRTPKPLLAGSSAKAVEAFLRTLLLALFIPAALYTFMVYDSPVDPHDLWILSAGSLALAVLFGGKSQRPSGYALWEEALLAALFLGAMWTFRGYRTAVPLLFSFGLSSMISFLIVQGVRLVTKHTVKLQNLDLRRGGRLTKLGVTFAGLVVLLAAGSVKIGYGRQQLRRGTELYQTALRYHLSGDPYSAELAFKEAESLAPSLKPEIDRFRNHQLARQANDRGVEAGNQGDLQGALGFFLEAYELDPELLQVVGNIAGAYCSLNNFEEGVTWYERAVEMAPENADLREYLALAYQRLGRHEDAEVHFKEVTRLRKVGRESP